MAEIAAAHLSMRPGVTLLTGLRATVAAAATATAGQSSFTLEIVTGCFIVAAAAIGPFINEFFRNRRTDRGGHALDEQTRLSAHLLSELEERDAELAEKDAEITRLRQRKPHA